MAYRRPMVPLRRMVSGDVADPAAEPQLKRVLLSS
jgi:hypothetical protein